MPVPQRPRFEPSPCDINPQDLTYPALEDQGSTWLPLISCPASFPPEFFELAVTQLVHHPEYNSTLILRSEVISEITSQFPPSIPHLQGGRQIVRMIHRRLLARRPARDGNLEQYCSFYGLPPHDDDNHEETITPDTLILTPIAQTDTPLPYYHPAVSHLALRYHQSVPPALRIEVVPLPGTPTDLNARLYRTCLALLDALDRYGWGALTNYKQRVAHDCLVSRESYQDLYLIMRERHKHLVDTWKQVTDPLKHVFEDVGIATYLMLLWKDTYSDSDDVTPSVDESTPWKSWPRPPGGFLDFGCGNGVLTHILIAEGYEGRGIDLRARISWPHYPETTRAHLHLHAFDPNVSDFPYANPGVFIIGNHPDELTPWVPVLATLSSASGYISIPCCPWSFDTRFDRSGTPKFPIPSDDFAGTLNLGQGGSESSYSKYRVWLAALSLHCGWEVECDTLRIPSTKDWAIIGRKKSDLMEPGEALENVRRILEDVSRRGIYKPRKPEGKKTYQ